jgi:hypothetical protein
LRYNQELFYLFMDFDYMLNIHQGDTLFRIYF